MSRIKKFKWGDTVYDVGPNKTSELQNDSGFLTEDDTAVNVTQDTNGDIKISGLSSGSMDRQMVVAEFELDSDASTITADDLIFDPVPWAKKYYIVIRSASDKYIGNSANSYISLYTSSGKVPYLIPLYFTTNEYVYVVLDLIQIGSTVFGLSFSTRLGYSMTTKMGTYEDVLLSNINRFTLVANGADSVFYSGLSIKVIAEG